MKIGYYVQGDADEAVVRGLATRWCPEAELAPGQFRGGSQESLRREIRKSLIDLTKYKACDVVVLLTDADATSWREVRTRESAKIPDDYQHVTVLGVAERNIECWMAIDRHALAKELQCPVGDIPEDDPSDFVKRRFELTDRDKKGDARKRVHDFVAGAPLKNWIENSPSFGAFYRDARQLALRTGCRFPNELET